jgi:hypothetical protein
MAEIMQRRLATVLALYAIPAVLAGQAPSRKTEGEIAGSFFFGNTRQTVASTRAQFERSDSAFTFRVLGRFNYGELTQELGGTIVNKRSWETGANYDFHPYADFSPFVKVLWESSFENKIDRRMSAGAGTRYNVVRTPGTDLVLSMGAAGERTYPLNTTGVTTVETTTLARGLAALRWRRDFTPTLTFTSESAYQPALTVSDDYTVTSVNTLKVKLASFAALTLTFRDNYDNRAVSRGARVNNDGEALVGLLTTF